MKALEAIEEYKLRGDRVDEVLFHIISKELHHLQEVIGQKNHSIDLIGEQKLQSQQNERQLKEVLEIKNKQLDLSMTESSYYYSALKLYADGRVKDSGEVANKAVIKGGSVAVERVLLNVSNR